jgi:hypothetical protein
VQRPVSQHSLFCRMTVSNVALRRHPEADSDLRMDVEERQRHRQRLERLQDADLRAMAVLRRSDYLPEVVELACEEITRRDLSVPTLESYWKDMPQEWLANAGFCCDCWAQTTDESPGDSFTVNLIGTAVTGEEQLCPVCASTIKTKHFWIIVPLIPLGRYRVIRYGTSDYIGRRLRDDASATPKSGLRTRFQAAPAERKRGRRLLQSGVGRRVQQARCGPGRVSADTRK